MERDKDGFPMVNQRLAVSKECKNGICLRIFGEQGKGIDNDDLGFALLDVSNEVREDAFHLLLLPFKSNNMEGEDLEVAPGKILGDVKAHGLHLLDEALAGIFRGKEINGESLFHGAPDDLLGKDALPGIVLPFDEGQGFKGKTISDLLVELAVTGGDNLPVLASHQIGNGCHNEFTVCFMG